MPRNLPKKAKISHEHGPIMPARPELAVYIARIATGWSGIEQAFGRLGIQLLGAHAHTGMKMYRALSGSASRNAVLRAIAKDRLPENLMNEFEELMRATKKTAMKRNNVVHGMWELSDDLPNALVWHDSSDGLLNHGEFWGGWLSRSLEDRFKWALEERRVEPMHLVYEAKDFDEILDEMNLLMARLMTFTRECMKLNEPPSDETSLAKA